MSDSERYLTFQLGGELFGCPLEAVREIRELAPVTPLPSARGWVRGLMNARGAVIPVLDLGVRMGAAPAEAGRFGCVVLVERPQGDDCPVVALVADRVSGLLELAAGDVQEAPSFGTRFPLELLRGLARGHGGFVSLLDLSRLLADEALEIAAAPAAEAS